jgi:hypothetical protein
MALGMVITPCRAHEVLQFGCRPQIAALLARALFDWHWLPSHDSRRPFPPRQVHGSSLLKINRHLFWSEEGTELREVCVCVIVYLRDI